MRSTDRPDRHFAGQELVKHDAHRELVGAVVNLLATHLLGGHVVGRAQGQARARELAGPQQAGDPEVHHLHCAVVTQPDVFGLDVAMDRLAVRELECGTQLIGDAAHLGNREPLGQLGAAVDLLPQVVAFEELHGQERRAGGLVEVVDADDVGVGQGAGDPGLVQEPFEGLGISQELREEELDGDLFLADTVEGDEDLAHAAGADVGADFVAVGENLAGVYGQRDTARRRLGMRRGSRGHGSRGASRQVELLGEGEGRRIIAGHLCTLSLRAGSTENRLPQVS